MQRKYLPYATPSIDDVERVLYIALREETDAFRNHILPETRPAGSLMHAHIWNNVLHYTFFRPLQEHLVPSRINSRHEHKRLASCRSWYFQWEGPAVGPVLLDRMHVARLGQTRAHEIAGRKITKTTIVDESLLAFVNRHLYCVKEVA